MICGLLRRWIECNLTDRSAAHTIRRKRQFTNETDSEDEEQKEEYELVPSKVSLGRDCLSVSRQGQAAPDMAMFPLHDDTAIFFTKVSTGTLLLRYVAPCVLRLQQLMC